MSALEVLPCIDSDEMARTARRTLDIPHDVAVMLGRSAVAAADEGRYSSRTGRVVEWRDAVARAIASKRSIPPEAPLAMRPRDGVGVTRVQVRNETTLNAARRLVAAGTEPLALNFANGIVPGGGFLFGARAQEECLCRSSALFHTLVGDPMYDAHRERDLPDSTDWTIHSPHVPVFRDDDGHALDEPWTVGFLTCAAPYAPGVGQPASGDLLERRIRRVLAIAESLGAPPLVLGAWGCGAFGNDLRRTAADFRRTLEGEFAGVFPEVVFAIADSSPERKTLGAFRDAFAAP